jgi:hypothetical protein
MYVIRVSVWSLCYPINRCKRSKNPQILVALHEHVTIFCKVDWDPDEGILAFHQRARCCTVFMPAHCILIWASYLYVKPHYGILCHIFCSVSINETDWYLLLAEVSPFNLSLIFWVFLSIQHSGNDEWNNTVFHQACPRICWDTVNYRTKFLHNARHIL